MTVTFTGDVTASHTINLDGSIALEATNSL